MAVTLQGIRPGFPKAEFSLSERKYTVQWLVISDNYNDGPMVAQSASGLPAAYSTYSIGTDADVYARIREWSAWRIEDNSLEWIVQAVYSTPPIKESERRGAGEGSHQDNNNAYQNPLNELPVAKTTMVERDRLITRVFNLQTGFYNPPMNSACEPFNPPPSYKTYDLQLTISRNEAVSSLHPALGVQFAGAVNADWFWGLSPGTWICKGIAAENQWRQVQGGTEYGYMRVEYTFQARPEGWDIFVLDAGDYFCPPLGSGSGCSGFASGFGGNSGPGSGLGSGSGPTGYDSYVVGKASGVSPPPGCPCCVGANKIGFIDQQGHPIKGMLDGMGGRLPDGGTPVWMQLRPYNWLPYAYLALPSGYSGCQ